MKRWRAGMVGVGLATGLAIGGGRIAQNSYEKHNTSRVHATVKQVARRASEESLRPVNELPWTVLVEAKKIKPTPQGKAFDRAVEELFSKRKQQDQQDKILQQRGQFPEYGIERFIESLTKLPDVEVEQRLRTLYSEDYEDYQTFRTKRAKQVQDARAELQKYFNERAARAIAESRVATSSYEKRALVSIAKNAKKIGMKTGALTGLRVLVAYSLLLGYFYTVRKMKTLSQRKR